MNEKGHNAVKKREKHIRMKKKGNDSIGKNGKTLGGEMFIGNIRAQENVRVD